MTTDLDALVETAAKALADAAEQTEGATEDSRCLADEEECFRTRPVHFAWYQLGETGVVGETKAIARTVIEAALAPLVAELATATAERDRALSLLMDAAEEDAAFVQDELTKARAEWAKDPTWHPAPHKVDGAWHLAHVGQTCEQYAAS